MATASTSEGESPLYSVRLLDASLVDDAVACLRRHTRDNLFLIDTILRLDPSKTRGRRGETSPTALGIFEDERLVGVATLRPTIAFDHGLRGPALEVAHEAATRLGSGLIRSQPDQCEALWRRLEGAGRVADVDRQETLLCLESADFLREGIAVEMDGPRDESIREAHLADLGALVHGARASLREEGRPDPFLGDPNGFRRWVRNRLPRAMVIERAGRVIFVGYADVKLPFGWLLQGIYTWPDHRRRGVAARGVAALCAKAFANGSDHVQLSVVVGNHAAEALYRGLGFSATGSLRTLLFGSAER